MEKGIKTLFSIVALLIQFSLYITSCVIYGVCVCMCAHPLLFNELDYNMRKFSTEKHSPVYNTGVPHWVSSDSQFIN